MKKYIPILLILLIASSCISTGNFLTDRSINKTLTSESSEVKITTTVEKFSPSKEWYYGKIEIENKTEKNLRFNFNQCLKIDGRIINADYNFQPVSYAYIAFRILPKTTQTWEVVWRINQYEPDSEQIKILNDLTLTEFNLIE